MIAKLTLRGVLARKWRILLTTLAVVSGVAFVSGAFILSDSLKRSFDGLFSDLNEGVDLEVRTKLAFGDASTSPRDPMPESVVDTIAAVEGVAAVEPAVARSVTFIKDDGTALRVNGPSFGIAWSGNESIGGTRLKAGAPPNGPNEVAIDKATADREGWAVGDTVTLQASGGKRDFTLSGLVGRGDDDGFIGAAISMFDLATAQEFLDAQGVVDTVDLAIAEGASVDDVRSAIAEVLPPNTEVVTGQQVAEETADGINQFISIFGNVLLGFAAVAMFVSSFLIFNTFQIIVSQRLRELALLRAIGANARQIRTMIIGESLLIGGLATVIGLVGGVVVSKGIVALFNAAGAGFPGAATVIAPRTVIAAVVVGIGVTLASALVPALRASRVPPIAAMNPDLGFTALQASRRMIVGGVTLLVGVTMFLVGMFLKPGGTQGTLLSSGLGAILLFLGVASLSTMVARPLSNFIGRPIAKLFKVPGRLARENAARQPRRTASTASALMIGLALVCLVSVVAASVRTTFVDQLKTSVTADFFITDANFSGLPSSFATELAALDELDAVSPFRAAPAQVDGDTKQIGGVEPTAFADLVDVDIIDGSIPALADGGVALHRDPAKDLGVGVGDTITITWQNGNQSDLPVVGVYADGAIAGNWLVSLETMEAATTAAPVDFFIGARIADGVDITTAQAAVDKLAENYPSAQVDDQAEFRERQEGQLNQLLAIIYGLLAFAVAIAIIGIANTMALSVFERTREFGLLRAVGMDRRQLRRAVRWESVIVSVFGAVLGVLVGVPLGIAVSWALPDTLIASTTIPYGTLVLILLLSIVVGLVAAWRPARRASKLNVLDAIASV
jgi:putative ABC transport system permease protein